MAKPNAVDAFLATLPADKRAALTSVRTVINKRLPRGFEESLQGKMIAWAVPLSVKPDTYNKQPLMLAGLAAGAAKSSLYLIPAYSDPKLLAAFQAAHKRANKKLDMGMSCVRFKSADDLVLDAIGDAIAEHSVSSWIAIHDAQHSKAATAKRRTARGQQKAKAPASAKASTRSKRA